MIRHFCDYCDTKVANRDKLHTILFCWGEDKTERQVCGSTCAALVLRDIYTTLKCGLGRKDRLDVEAGEIKALP